MHAISFQRDSNGYINWLYIQLMTSKEMPV
uniref:Uncharacterized protein n=1 Tax=Arundo donax TaxID=35708 RepID=A0A0A9BXZ3_ARUDO